MHRVLLALMLLVATAVPAHAWNEARTRHFIIYSQQKPDELRRYAERLERFDTAVRKLRGMKDPDLTDGGKLTIYVVPTVREVEALSSEGVGGFYIPRASGSIVVLSSEVIGSGTRRVTPEQIFFHEYKHHLMLGASRVALPAWVVEGSAEFFATARIEEDGSVLLGAPPQEHGYLLSQDMGFSARQLLSGEQAKAGEDVLSVYAKGWLLTHYLTFSPGRAGQLGRYLVALNQGRTYEAAATEAFGDLGKLDIEVDRYARSSSFGGIRIPSGPKPQVSIRPLSAGEAAIMRVRIRSDRGASGRRSEAILADAIRIASQHPQDAFVQGVLAEAYYDVKKYQEAIAAADRALAVQPESVQALVYKGRALMELGRADPAKADWTAVRSVIAKANRLDTENAEPLFLFYQSFEAAGQKPSESALKGLYYAHALAPQDQSLRLAVVRRLIAEQRVKDAARVFGTIVYNPHLSVRARKPLSDALAKMQEGDGAGAIAILEAEEKAREERARS